MLRNAVVWIGPIGLLIWAVSRFFTQRGPTAGQPQSGPSALDILRQQLDSPAAREPLCIPPAR